MDHSLRITYFEEIIRAAKEGRFCFGNGNNYYIVDTDRKTVIQYETAGQPPTKEAMNADNSARYLATTPAHQDDRAVTTLTEFIKTLR